EEEPRDHHRVAYRATREPRDEDDDDREPAVDEQRVPNRTLRRRNVRDAPLQLLRHSSSPTVDSTASTSEPSRTAAATVSMSPPSGRSSRNRFDSDRTAAWVARAPAPGSSGARNSTACAAAMSSMATARSEFATTCHAFRPAAFPIET